MGREGHFEVISGEMSELFLQKKKHSYFYFSFVQQLLVRIPEICTVKFSCMSPVRIALYFRNFA